jgi:hypothetical protein
MLPMHDGTTPGDQAPPEPEAVSVGCAPTLRAPSDPSPSGVTGPGPASPPVRSPEPSEHRAGAAVDGRPGAHRCR